MKRFFFLTAAFIVAHIVIVNVYAQERVETIAWLQAEILPDYDQPSVLVLLTGGLPEGTSLPATVVVPLPPSATVNAVARISAENQMIDDIEYSVEEDAVSLVTPDLRFRVEYYMPYNADNLQRHFAFRWQSEVAVQELFVSVQQPLAATSLTTEPQASSIGEGSDGLQFYSFPAQAVAAGEPFVLEVNYTMDRPELTVSALSRTADGSRTGTAPFNWPLFLVGLAGILMLVLLGWRFLGGRLNLGSGRTGKPTVRRGADVRGAASEKRARFCHQCGERAQEGDRFCRACGTRLKGT